MSWKIYAIKDDITGFDGSLYKFSNDEDAKREFVRAITEEGSKYHAYRKDYSLWAITEMDPIEGRVKELTPRMLIRGESIKTEGE